MKCHGLTSFFLHNSSNNTRHNMSHNSSSSNFNCNLSEVGLSINVAFFITKMIAVLPLSVIILYLGYQQWRRQRSFTETSHCDVFTYHVAAIELTFVCGTIVLGCGEFTNQSVLTSVGIYATAISYPGEMFFNIVTCVERYLAVVHPITYLGLRQSGGVRIRNICICCVWLLCFGWVCVIAFSTTDSFHIPFFCITAISLVTTSLCSLSVLCALIGPGPGEMGGDRQRVVQSKRKAFHTITAIMLVLLMSFLGTLLTIGLNNMNLLSDLDRCIILVSGNFCSLPTSLVLPLLFLQRAGKLSFCLFCKK